MKCFERQIDWSLPQIRRLHLKSTVAVCDLGNMKDNENHEFFCEISLNIFAQNNLQERVQKETNFPKIIHNKNPLYV